MSSPFFPVAPINGNPTIADPTKLTPMQLWTTEIAYAEQELKKFHERGRKVVRRYVDERDAVDAQMKWFNLYYANTKILRAALYSQAPQPEVKRKFLDYNDQLARVAATILQRAITPDCDDPRDTFDSTMKHVTLDRLVPGLGMAWCRLETDTEDAELILEDKPSVGEGLPPPQDHHNSPLNSGFATGPAPDSQQQQPGQPQIIAYKRITDQRVAVDYVYWEDFLWSPCRVWEENRWTARRVYMDRQQLVSRFGEEIGNAVPLNHRPSGSIMATYPTGITPMNQAIEQAVVYEIWDRIHRKVIWLCKDYPQVLDEKDDFLNLIGFYPHPKPLLANITTSNTVPRPDYQLVQDQYGELDTVNNRISMLVQACKVVGVYDRASEGVQRMLLEGFDNTLIPVDNWAMFAEKGGVKGQVDWLPLEQVVRALQQLNESREVIKGQIYELTGIADIVRGDTKASETLGAQEIKAKFASIRIRDVQDEVALFAAQVLRIKAEIMVKHYDPEILIRKSNIMRTDDAHLAQPAIQLLQSEEGFEWRILVTADQLAQADYALQKQERIELLTSVSGYLQSAGAMFMQVPSAAPLLIGMLKWAVAGFRGARDIEGMLDRELTNLLKQAEQGDQQEKPDPEAQKQEAEIKKIEMETQAAAQKAHISAQSDKMKLGVQAKKSQLDLMVAQAKHQQQMQQMQERSIMQLMTGRAGPGEPQPTTRKQ
jgi:hypothetical protein